MGTNTYAYGFKYGLKPGEIAYKGIKHYVFSSSLEFPSNDDVTLVKSDAAAFTRSLKSTESKPIWLCGGGELAGALLKAKLIDKLILKINPIAIGNGIRLFGSSEQSFDLELLDFKRYESGVMRPTYRINYR
jgi:dihydrofolate reductase